MCVLLDVGYSYLGMVLVCRHKNKTVGVTVPRDHRNDLERKAKKVVSVRREAAICRILPSFAEELPYPIFR